MSNLLVGVGGADHSDLRPHVVVIGLSFCEPCIKSKYFMLVKHVCPLCRKRITCSLEDYAVNVLLDQILKGRYNETKGYRERVIAAKQSGVGLKENRWAKVRRWVKQKMPWIIILVLLYHLFKVKVNFFSFNFKDYKDKALEIANSIKVEHSLDFKFLLFSQFMRLLFSTIIIP